MQAAERPSPPTRQANGGHGYGGRRVSYAEDAEDDASGSDADEDARRAAIAAKNATVAALLEPDELAEMDDEVERVISHRWVYPRGDSVRVCPFRGKRDSWLNGGSGAGRSTRCRKTQRRATSGATWSSGSSGSGGATAIVPGTPCPHSASWAATSAS